MLRYLGIVTVYAVSHEATIGTTLFQPGKIAKPEGRPKLDTSCLSLKHTFSTRPKKVVGYISELCWVGVNF